MILENLRELFEDSSDTTQRRLEAEAKNATLAVGQTISEYITAHKFIRRKMFQASFPKNQRRANVGKNGRKWTGHAPIIQRCFQGNTTIWNPADVKNA